MQAVKVSEGTGVSEKIGTVTVGERTKKKKERKKRFYSSIFLWEKCGWLERQRLQTPQQLPFV